MNYHGEFVNTETNAANENIQKLIEVYIEDTEAADPNPYNINYEVLPGTTPGTLLIRVFFNNLTVEILDTTLQYSIDNGANWVTATTGLTSPHEVEIPDGLGPYAYLYRLVMNYADPADDEIFYLDSLDTQTEEIEMAETPVKISVIDNNEDKFTPIRAKQAEIQIFSSNSISISTFATGGDNRWKVTIYSNFVPVFIGFLSISDLSQEFMPDPNIITLIATDGLGFLNDIPLTDFDGNTPQNENDILSYLLWSLNKTGLELNLAATFNIREETAIAIDVDTTAAGHFFKYCFLDAKTFEAEIGECENCYDVISKILGREACLFQNQGEWRIVRIDEMDFGIDYYTVRWIYTGELSYIETEVKEKSLGVGSEYSWMNDDAIVGLVRPVKELRLTYNYELPAEIPCNIDFSRGDFIADLPDSTIEGETIKNKSYVLDCWDKLWSNTSTDDPQTTGIYIQRSFSVNDYELERFLVLEFISGRFTFVMSEAIPVTIKDKFTLDVQRRLSGDISGSGFYRDNHIQVRLYGNDGTFWTFRSKTSASDVSLWRECDSTFRTNQSFFSIEGDLDEDLTETKTLYDGEATPIPVSGYIKILLYRTSLVTSSRDTYINCKFEYIPFINGSYQKYKGQQQIMTNGETRDIKEEQVFISDSPKKLFKGALLIDNGTDFVTTNRFYNAAVAGSSVMPYGQIQLFDNWNQLNRVMVYFDGTVDKTDPLPDLMDKFTLTDINQLTTGRIFILLHYEMDKHLCEWTTYFIEVANSGIVKVTTGSNFKYITE